MKHIEHIGIAVKDLDQAIENYSVLLNTPCFKKETVLDQQVDTAFFQLDKQKIELLAARSSNSSVGRFLERSGEGIHHIAFEVADVTLEMERLASEGFRPLQDKPFPGADNKMVAFFHPKTANGVLIEICQEIKNNE